MARPAKSFKVNVCGWVGDYWLATAADMKRLVRTEPEVRHGDRHEIRWNLVAAAATEALLAARTAAGPYSSPSSAGDWDVTVKVTPPELLRSNERWIVESIFYDPAVADRVNSEVTNGRHRMYYSWSAGAPALPVQSKAVSDWSHQLFEDPSCTNLELQVAACAYLFNFAGRCETWRRQRGADRYFIDGIRDALGEAEDFLDSVASAADGVKPGPWMQERI